MADTNKPAKPDEEWRPIFGYEGVYEVSNYGRIRSVTKTLPHKKHGTWTINGHIMKPSLSGGGSKQYFSVILHDKFGNTKSARVHRLVAMAFIPNPLQKPEVNHIDGNTHNNSVLNLEWVTGKENMEHAKRIGLLEFAYKGIPVKNEDTGEVFPTCKKAGEKYGIRGENIARCAKGRTKKSAGYRWSFAV